MSRFLEFVRLLSIARVLSRHRLDEVLLASHLFRPLRWFRVFAPWSWFRAQNDNRGASIRLSLEELGPIFVKFGQILSTRRDLLPDDIANELSKLQDQVPPFDSELAKTIIEQAYSQSISEIFAEFESSPLASASVAQVHCAKLHSGEDVIVKVLRPDIAPVIKRDIRLMYSIARKVERYWSQGKRLHPIAVVREFEKTILDELDFMREAANASQLRSNFDGSELLYVPEVYWNYSRSNVLVMERIYGIPVNDLQQLQQQQIDLKKLSEHGVEIFFTQVFRDSFFHADMHPGNIFVSNGGQYMAVDFGIMGTLSSEDQRYLAENFLAFFKRDYRRVAELHVHSGWVAKDTRIDEFEAAIRTVCEPIFDKPLKEISFGQLLIRLFFVAQRFNMEVQPQLVLLQKTLLNIEGLGRQLYPDLDLWKTAKPFLEKWVASQFGPKALFRHIRTNAPLWVEQLPKMPTLLFEALEKINKGEIEYKVNAQQIDEIKLEIKKSNQKTVRAIFGSGFIISSALLINVSTSVINFLPHFPLLSASSAIVGFILLLSIKINKR
ncbi:Ubiquinone biosynthesis regulatory protein kinase UbiB [hydrothermal vent metagenome]|uniref:Ubiquinone biosynthesis regulatory protein kinase UbiB n=1 Tax=hydrothermal vent metagenome TaxID=652676 RepID=A0A3B1AFB9_9ZZZZ